MDNSVPPLRKQAGIALPWMLGAAFFVLYLATLNPWMSMTSAPVTTAIGGFDHEWAWQRPVLALLTAPLRWLPKGYLPQTANFLAALMGAGTVAILARCVQLLPRDRTPEERIRGGSEAPRLKPALVWAPPLLAATLLGLQLTFWEHATAQTGEIWDVLVFSWCVRCLMEFRHDRKDRWLWQLAVVYGVSITNNWAMIGFAPLFAVAVLWIRGLHGRFLVQFLGFGLLGVSFYLVIPSIGLLLSGSSPGWLTSLDSLLLHQRSILLGLPRPRFLLLALVNLLPLAYIGVRWKDGQGSGVERLALALTLICLQAAGLGANFAMAFDLPFGPRQMVYLDAAAGGIPLLTFHFCSALLAAHFAGYFLHVGGTAPTKPWKQSRDGTQWVGRIAYIAVLATTVALPPTLLFRNGPKLARENQSHLRDVAIGLREKLPRRGAVVLNFDPLLHQILVASEVDPEGPDSNLYILESQMPDPLYRQHLVRSKATSAWPEWASVAEAKTNIAGQFLPLWQRAAQENKAYLLSLDLNFSTEGMKLTPCGLAYQVEPGGSGLASGILLHNEDAAVLMATWEKRSPLFEVLSHAQMAGSSPTVRWAAQVWSRAANVNGVACQRGRQWSNAKSLFQIALNVDPDNVAARINLMANADLAAGRSVGAQTTTAAATFDPGTLYHFYGPIEEPQSLVNLGRSLLLSSPPQFKSAGAFFLRARELNPDFLRASLGYIASELNQGHPDLALAEVNQVGDRTGLTVQERVSLLRFKVAALGGLNRIRDIEKCLASAREQMPREVAPIELLVDLYFNEKQFERALPLLDEWMKLEPRNTLAASRKAQALLLLQRNAEALPLLTQLIDREPGWTSVRANRAVALMRLKKLDEAQREYERLLETDSGNFVFHAGLAEVSELQQRPKQALQHWESFLANAPHSTEEFTNALKKVERLRKML